jgi:hypothetical protein
VSTLLAVLTVCTHDVHELCELHASLACMLQLANRQCDCCLLAVVAGVMLGRIEMEGDATVLPFSDPNVKNLVAEVSCCYSCVAFTAFTATSCSDCTNYEPYEKHRSALHH